jgi:hypothetical protein
VTIETNAARIIGELIHGPGMVWTSDILSTRLGIEISDTWKAITWAKLREYVVDRHDAYFVTLQGRNYYDDSCRNSTLNFPETPKWKDEVLTGICEVISLSSGFVVSEKSNIDRAVLQTGNETHYKDPEEQIDAYRRAKTARKNLALSLKMTEKDLMDAIVDGRVRPCNYGDAPHLGVFDRNGAGWQSYCRRCRREIREGRWNQPSRTPSKSATV